MNSPFFIVRDNHLFRSIVTAFKTLSIPQLDALGASAEAISQFAATYSQGNASLYAKFVKDCIRRMSPNQIVDLGRDAKSLEEKLIGYLDNWDVKNQANPRDIRTVLNEFRIKELPSTKTREALKKRLPQHGKFLT